MDMTKVAFLVAGTKGIGFFREMHARCEVVAVFSYQPGGTVDNSYEELVQLCGEWGYRLQHRERLDSSLLRDADVIFIAGWQFLMREVDERFVVLHDSLLPRYRGFAPTVTALIRGDIEVGVSALKPAELADRGAIYGQVPVPIKYPVKVRAVYERLSIAYADVATVLVCHLNEFGRLPEPVEQDEDRATYSIWRDELDYLIDWTTSASEIRRLVDAAGWPYLGARTSYLGSPIVLDEVEEIPDLRFESRAAGKIWRICENQPEIVCGKGILRIHSARSLETGAPVQFTKLRTRMGT